MSSTKKYLAFQRACHTEKTFMNPFMDSIEHLNDIAKGIVPSTKEEWEQSQAVLKSLKESAESERRHLEKRAAKRAARKAKVVRGGRP